VGRLHLLLHVKGLRLGRLLLLRGGGCSTAAGGGGRSDSGLVLLALHCGG